MSGSKLNDNATNKQIHYDDYLELLVKRDQLYKDAGSFLTVYTREFGELLLSNFEMRVACIRMKKTISYCRRRMNRGLTIDTARMQSEIDGEMKLYYVQLKEMADGNEAARNARTVSEYRLSRSRKIYRRLARKIHPDVNPLMEENEPLQDLWERIVQAYRMSDVEALEDLEELVRNVMRELGTDYEVMELPDLEDRILRLEREINEILTTEPYTYGALLRDEEKKASFHAQLKTEQEDLEEYYAGLTEILDKLLLEGGTN